jgi:gliding motility-associated-like protein
MKRIGYSKIKTILAGLMINLCWMVILDAQIIPINGLIAYYPFNGNPNDESGNGINPDAAYASYTSDRCGNPVSAYKSGKITHIYLPPANFDGLNEYTYSLWFRADSIPSLYRWILFSVGSPAEGIEQAFTFAPDRTLTGSSFNVGGNPPLITISSVPVDTGRWIHAVLTRNDTSLRIFINGTLAASSLDLISPGHPADYGTDPKATIGCQLDESIYSFIGAIDEVRIYNRALSEIEVKQLYDSYPVCSLSEISGPTEVCQGQNNLVFSVIPLENGSNYDWKYTGIGATISGNGSTSVTVDFDSNATSGTLTVTVTGNFMDPQSRSQDIQVKLLPSDAGIISGKEAVCQGDSGVIYQIPAIENATSYTWTYNGSVFPGNSNILSVDFSANAISGNLMVTGNNSCGEGSASPPFPIAISQLPSNPGSILGESVVCQGQQGVTYSIPIIQNATGYTWNYSGTGITFTGGDSNAIKVSFNNVSTSGDLTVMGFNDCGNSTSPSVFLITVLSVPAEAGTISGENAVCLNQNGASYFVSSIEYATSYSWQYSGTGALLNGNTNTVAIDFSARATNGTLTVAGHNDCGEGLRSPEFSITVSDCSVNPVEITIPNSFSPNGDGVNDVFIIRGLPQNSTLIIFDRAGRKLFESDSYANDWDGKDRAGNALVSGTYWYVLSVSGQPEEYKGFVYLKR